MQRTVFERCGGFAVVRRIVSAFYDRVLDSEDLARYFADASLERLVDHQTKFIATLMGGPASFSDEALQRAHARLGITSEEFRAMVELLRETLDEFGLERPDVDDVCREMARREPLIVSPAARASAA